MGSAALTTSITRSLGGEIATLQSSKREHLHLPAGVANMLYLFVFVQFRNKTAKRFCRHCPEIVAIIIFEACWRLALRIAGRSDRKPRCHPLRGARPAGLRACFLPAGHPLRVRASGAFHAVAACR